ncbi:MAG: 16S rRNA (guanine(527)-N(7))-methyltransferase RsmG [Actinomycetes bacterium]
MVVSRETLAWDRPDPGDPWPPVLVLDPFAALLAEVAVERGLIGPREVPRLWQRHLLNCAVVGIDLDLLPEAAHVVDVGAGAGLPGLVWALTRPDLEITCVEPLLRRATFLTEAVELLGLGDRVKVVRARAEDLAGSFRADVVTARAVAPLTRLANWALPLTRIGGRVLAFKGADAVAEVAEAAATLARSGAAPAVIRSCSAPGLTLPTTLVDFARLR